MSKRTASTRSRESAQSSQQKKAKNGENRPSGSKKLDFLNDDTSYETLLSGYTQEQLKELQEKLKDVQLEAIRNLDYENDIREVIGAKLDGKNMWFCVKWEGGEISFIPSNIIQRIAPNKVIEYYESIVKLGPQIDQPEENNNNNNSNNNDENNNEKLVKVKEEIIGLESLNEVIMAGDGDSFIDSQVVRLQGRMEILDRPQQKELEKENREKEKNREVQKPSSNSSKQKVAVKTIHCTGCGVKLQFPAGTKLIKCPNCSHIMQTIAV